MTRLVNAVLDATGKRAIADTDGVLGERELSNAQECAVTLLQLGAHSPDHVKAALSAFQQEFPRFGAPSYRQLAEAASKAKPQVPATPVGYTRNSDGSLTTEFAPPKVAYAA